MLRSLAGRAPRNWVALMAEQQFTRRTSYGPSSPVIGSRGARTRQQIVDTALRCFTEDGFHGTSMDDIAHAAETSRATLYQYFESKEAIFIELMQSAGTALSRVTRRLGPLGPTAEGFDNLHWWLGEWSWVFDRYSAMFIEWANVNSPKAPLRPLLARFVEGHAERFGRTLIASGYTGDETAVMSTLVLALTNRFNYIRHVYRPGISDARLLLSLAIGLQLTLFPDTPVSVLEAGPASIERAEAETTDITPIPRMGPLATLPEDDEPLEQPSIAPLSPQAANTVRQLLAAGAKVFADNGYDATNVDQIVTEAGLARGTFYRYFDDKLDLMIALARECAAEMSGPIRDLARFGAHPDPAGLRQWLREFSVLHRRYSGVLRAWTEGFPIEPAVLAPCRETVTAMSIAIIGLFGPMRSYPFDRRAGGMLLAGLLEHFPNEGKGSEHEPTPEQLVEAQALFIERVLLAR
ncbi:MAG: TetR/AcrR family transcriptional regulator [Actinomycetota bacterium]|nr:TetR/AcrR family transcriptional regulator [Actinomycetota bacterium]